MQQCWLGFVLVLLPLDRVKTVSRSDELQDCEIPIISFDEWWSLA